ncbi:MAG: class I adenylate-forming enzyme family protein [Acidimicrobiales bacterium]
MTNGARTDILASYALAFGDKPALIEDRAERQIRWTFAQLDSMSNRLANVLAHLGVVPGDKVVWCGPNSAEIVTAMHAIRKVGATAVPLNYRLSPDEAAYVIDNCDAGLIYIDAEYAPLLSSIRDGLARLKHVVVFGGPAPAGCLDGDALVAKADSSAPPQPAGEGGGPATMIYTSGTTGHPKGALRRGGGDPTQVAALIAHVGYSSDDIYLTTGPLYHSGPGGFMTIAHALGNTVVVQRKFEAEDWLRLIASHRVTSTFSAPATIRLACNLAPEVKARYDRSSMRVMIANAAPWPMALKQAYLADFPAESLWEVYGSTELGVDAVLAPPDQLRKPGSCGLPAPGVELMLLDDDGAEIAASGVPGELFVRSKSVFSTYYKAEEKYQAGRHGEFHSVGDIAYRDEEGYYYICDRKSDMIISGGMNVYPAEIEAVIEAHPDVFEVAVFGIPSQDWGEAVHAVVVAQPTKVVSEQEVTNFAREHLAGYKVPKSVSFMDELPRTGSGKTLKRVLREPYWKDQERGVS